MGGAGQTLSTLAAENRPGGMSMLKRSPLCNWPGSRYPSRLLPYDVPLALTPALTSLRASARPRLRPCQWLGPAVACRPGASPTGAGRQDCRGRWGVARADENTSAQANRWRRGGPRALEGVWHCGGWRGRTRVRPLGPCVRDRSGHPSLPAPLLPVGTPPRTARRTAHNRHPRPTQRTPSSLGARLPIG